MTYSLAFHEKALKEWKKLDNTIQSQFKKKLMQRLENPHVPASALHGIAHCYKIKLKDLGYRLVYTVDDNTVYVKVIAIGKRERLEAYTKAKERI